VKDIVATRAHQAVIAMMHVQDMVTVARIMKSSA